MTSQNDLSIAKITAWSFYDDLNKNVDSVLLPGIAVPLISNPKRKVTCLSLNRIQSIVTGITYLGIATVVIVLTGIAKRTSYSYYSYAPATIGTSISTRTSQSTLNLNDSFLYLDLSKETSFSNVFKNPHIVAVKYTPHDLTSTQVAYKSDPSRFWFANGLRGGGGPLETVTSKLNLVAGGKEDSFTLENLDGGKVEFFVPRISTSPRPTSEGNMQDSPSRRNSTTQKKSGAKIDSDIPSSSSSEANSVLPKDLKKKTERSATEDFVRARSSSCETSKPSSNETEGRSSANQSGALVTEGAAFVGASPEFEQAVTSSSQKMGTVTHSEIQVDKSKAKSKSSVTNPAPEEHVKHELLSKATFFGGFGTKKKKSAPLVTSPRVSNLGLLNSLTGKTISSEVPRSASSLSSNLKKAPPQNRRTFTSKRSFGPLVARSNSQFDSENPGDTQDSIFRVAPRTWSVRNTTRSNLFRKIRYAKIFRSTRLNYGNFQNCRRNGGVTALNSYYFKNRELKVSSSVDRHMSIYLQACEYDQVDLNGVCELTPYSVAFDAGDLPLLQRLLTEDKQRYHYAQNAVPRFVQSADYLEHHFFSGGLSTLTEADQAKLDEQRKSYDQFYASSPLAVDFVMPGSETQSEQMPTSSVSFENPSDEIVPETQEVYGETRNQSEPGTNANPIFIGTVRLARQVTKCPVQCVRVDTAQLATGSSITGVDSINQSIAAVQNAQAKCYQSKEAQHVGDSHQEAVIERHGSASPEAAAAKVERLVCQRAHQTNRREGKKTAESLYTVAKELLSVKTITDSVDTSCGLHGRVKLIEFPPLQSVESPNLEEANKVVPQAILPDLVDAVTDDEKGRIKHKTSPAFVTLSKFIVWQVDKSFDANVDLETPWTEGCQRLKSNARLDNAKEILLATESMHLKEVEAALALQQQQSNVLSEGAAPLQEV